MRLKPSRCGLGLIMLLSLGCTIHTPTSGPAMHPSVISRVSFSDSKIQVTGRHETAADGSLRFAYPGVGVIFRASGHALWLQARSSSDQSYLAVTIDDGEPQVIRLSMSSERIPLFIGGDNSSTHKVEVMHRSETWHGIVTLEHMEIHNGRLLDPLTLPQRRLLILGDSVTCGEAIERTADCKKDTSWWNPGLSYGMLMAKALDAQVHLVCYGGRGLVRSWNGKTDELNLPDFFELTIADPHSAVRWDHTRYTPEVILSAIGTNDFSIGIPEREIYVSAYTRLVQRLLALHPNAQIALTEGAILNGEKKAALQEYLRETTQRVKDNRVHIIPSTYYPGDTCDAHPTKEQHAAMAKDLAPLVDRLLSSLIP